MSGTAAKRHSMNRIQERKKCQEPRNKFAAFGATNQERVRKSSAVSQHRARSTKLTDVVQGMWKSRPQNRLHDNMTAEPGATVKHPGEVPTGNPNVVQTRISKGKQVAINVHALVAPASSSTREAKAPTKTAEQMIRQIANTHLQWNRYVGNDGCTAVLLP